eukprot:12907833-Prorocentrum_lima.AAC.1
MADRGPNDHRFANAVYETIAGTANNKRTRQERRTAAGSMQGSHKAQQQRLDLPMYHLGGRNTLA